MNNAGKWDHRKQTIAKTQRLCGQGRDSNSVFTDFYTRPKFVELEISIAFVELEISVCNSL